MSSYPSKVLLFGEHIVNLGAEALAIPYPAFHAKLSFDNLHSDFIPDSPAILDLIYTYIAANKKLKGVYDLSAFRDDLDKALGFHMNIPIGYGLGSSGALTAAIFERYAKNLSLNEEQLKIILGETESFFHGKSSGLDPLVSYVNQGVWLGKECKLLEQDLIWRKDFEIFLVNTKKSRKTGPLVEAFLKRVESDEGFARIIDESIIPINNAIIRNFLKNDHEETLALVEQFSRLQIQHFKELILPEHIDLFMLGLATKEYFLKICGAGGGGFMLGFTLNKDVKLPFEVIWI